MANPAIMTYGTVFNSGDYPYDERLQDKLVWSISTGRWATCKEGTLFMLGFSNEKAGSGDLSVYWKTLRSSWLNYGNGDDNVFSSIPISRDSSDFGVPNINIGALNNLDLDENTADAQFMMGGAGGGLRDYSNWGGDSVSAYVFSQMKPITDWAFNEYAVYPYIAGVYANTYNEETQTFVNGNTIGFITGDISNNGQSLIWRGSCDVDQWFNHGGVIPETYNHMKLIGYTIKYAIFHHGGMSEVSSITFAMEDSCKDKITIGLNRELSVEKFHAIQANMGEAYSFHMGNTIIGPEGWAVQSNGIMSVPWRGPTDIENTECCVDSTLMCKLKSPSGTSPGLIGGIPCVPRSFLDWLIDTDVVKMALQFGFPVIWEPQTLKKYRQGTNISECSDDYVAFPDMKSNNQINLDTIIKGHKDIEQTKLWKDSEDGKGAMDSTQRPDRKDVDDNNYVGEVPLNLPTFTTIGVFNRYFAMSFNDVVDLADFLYTDDENQIALIMKGLQLNGENPMNFMIGLRMFPFNILEYMQNHRTEEISFGNGVRTGVMAEQLNEDDSFTIDLGYCGFPTYFKNFLDYEPYTTAKLYIPYCGEVEIPTSIFAGNRINVKLIVDITTGSCVGAVSLGSGKNEKYIMFVPGMCSVEIPMTGTNATEYISRGYDALNKWFSGTMQTAASVGAIGVTSMSSVASSGASTSTGAKITSSTSQSIGQQTSHNTKKDLPSAVGGVQSMVDGWYEWNNMPTPLQVQGNSTPYTSFFKPQCCYFIIQRPVLLDVNIDNTVGYACMKKVTISDLADGTMFIAQNPNVQPKHATYSETAELNHLLATGVWR